MTLQRKFSLVVFASAIIVAVIVGIFGLFQLKSTLVTGLNNEVFALGHGQSRTISEWSHSKAMAIQGLSHYLENEQVNELALQQAAISGDFQLAYMGTVSGEMIQSDPTSSLPEGYDPRVRPWYKKALESSEVQFTKPYVDAASGDLIISAAKSVGADQNLKGVVGADMSLQSVIDGVLKVKFQEKSLVFLVNKEGLLIAHPDQSLILKPITEALGYDLPTLMKGEEALFSTKSKAGDVLVSGVEIPGTNWIIGFQLDQTVAMSPLRTLFISLLFAMLVAAAVVSLVMSAVSRSLLSGVGRVNKVLAEMNQGQGDLRTRIPEGGKDEIGDLARHFNGFMQTLAGIITEIKGMSSDLNGLAKNSDRLASQSSKDLRLQLEEVTSVADAVGQMSTATHEIASNAESTANASREAHSNSEQGSQLVVKSKDSISYLSEEVIQASSVIGNLDKQVQSITGILVTIQNIAEQTNLLALNAAIEAARAGEQGRGFAVVADEVRVLSQRTQSSTEEIKAMLDGLNSTTGKVVDIMKRSTEVAEGSVSEAVAAAESLVAIKDSIQRISDMSMQIASAAEEQNIVTTDISTNSASIKDIANKLAIESHESAEGAKSLAKLAESLEKQVARFTI
ncbi:methyl-accepting chemotaxis protein [Marinomonas transparens]|uniref:Methyl-accepting chemotaxis protein n=1 Tax=Marinomonas transparens TaxID=2795388 RepID=A0A934MY31_9GAMM|nr:methyl-accepting chemotaxis protein [Marinomonas transparens]MBJ7539979.1 methyl-accepting chemotaxis protein [Marinomonas transparens]